MFNADTDIIESEVAEEAEGGICLISLINLRSAQIR